MYSQAAHCYEELILHQPHHIPYYVQYADVLYTIGGSNGHNYRTARAYYAAAVQLSGGKNVRALYGLTACAAQLGGIKVGGYMLVATSLQNYMLVCFGALPHIATVMCGGPSRGDADVGCLTGCYVTA